MSDEKTLTEHLFRRKYGEILATLLRTIGYEHFELAEESVQSAFQRALEKWPLSGTPSNPSGWLYQVARNAALESLRRQSTEERKLEQLTVELQQEEAQQRDEAFDGVTGLDDLATMILLCCNPDVSAKSQVCLTLKAACGFSIGEISRALGEQEETIKKTITRAKQKTATDPEILHDLNPNRIAGRFALVMETIYAMFTEGYSASGGELQLRRDIAEEAMRLVDVFLRTTFTPEVYKGDLQALLALMLFQYARFDAREDGRGIPVRLQEQDRAKWNQRMIHTGLAALEASKASTRLTPYHIEARIAAEHSTSVSFKATNWKHIQDLYDELVGIKDSVEVQLNRIVAIRYGEGPQVAMKELQRFQASHRSIAMDMAGQSFLFHAVRADLLEAVENYPDARDEWRKALESAPTAADRAFVEEKVRNLF